MKKTIIAMAISALLAGCATQGGQNSTMSENQRAITGAAIGAIAGAVIGHQTNKGGALTGAILGGVAGAAIGHEMDLQEQAFKKALAQERAQNEVEVQRVRDNLLKLTLNNEVSFDFNKAAIRPGFKPTLDKLAGVLNKYTHTHVTIVGYTDSIGSATYNLALSRRRAEAVADYLMNRGVEAGRLSAEGRGEADPRASNATAAGRQLNRRVEILVQPDQAAQGGAMAPPPPPPQQ